MRDPAQDQDIHAEERELEAMEDATEAFMLDNWLKGKASRKAFQMGWFGGDREGWMVEAGVAAKAAYERELKLEREDYNE